MINKTQMEKSRGANSEILINILLDSKIITRSQSQREFILDIHKLSLTNEDMYNNLLDQPESFLSKLKKELINYFEVFKDIHSSTQEISSLKLDNFHDIEQISFLRIKNINKLIRFTGMISKTTKVIALVKSIEWECRSCGAKITFKGVQRPNRCVCGKTGEYFNAFHKEMQDIQEVEVEELQDEIGDRQPRKIRVRLSDELCDKEMTGILQPGNKIDIIGITQPLEIPTKTKEELFEYRILAINVKSLEEKFSDTF